MCTPIGSPSYYRTYIREIRKLPHDYLRQFFQLKVADDMRQLRDTEEASVRRTREARMARSLKKVQSALAGDRKAWTFILDHATGRRGKLKHELLEPLLRPLPSTPQPSPIIPKIPKSRPPVYSQEFVALMRSDLGRGPGEINNKWLRQPFGMPERVDPESEEAKMLGPLSKRREVNIRWRFYTKECDKIIPPLDLPNLDPESPLPSEKRTYMGDSGVFEQLLQIARSPHRDERLTRRQRKSILATGARPTPAQSLPEVEPLPVQVPRLIRRRYQELLSRIPVLMPPLKGKSGYNIVAHPDAIPKAVRFKSTLFREASASDIAWMDLNLGPDARKLDKDKGNMGRPKEE